MNGNINNNYKNYYDVLGVAVDATPEVIRKQFRRLAHVTHPDKNPEDVKAATVRFQLFQQAVDTLSDPEKWARYDAKHGRHQRQFRRAQKDKAKPSSSSSSRSSSSSSYRKFSFSSSPTYTFKYKTTGAEEISAKESKARKRRRQRQKQQEQRH